jgi:hypothetical protein
MAYRPGHQRLFRLIFRGFRQYLQKTARLLHVLATIPSFQIIFNSFVKSSRHSAFYSYELLASTKNKSKYQTPKSKSRSSLEQVTFTAMNGTYPECRGIRPRDPLEAKFNKTSKPSKLLASARVE